MGRHSTQVLSLSPSAESMNKRSRSGGGFSPPAKHRHFAVGDAVTNGSGSTFRIAGVMDGVATLVNETDAWDNTPKWTPVEDLTLLNVFVGVRE